MRGIPTMQIKRIQITNYVTIRTPTDGISHDITLSRCIGLTATIYRVVGIPQLKI